MTAVAMAAASGTGSDLDGISRWVVDVMEAVGAPGGRIRGGLGEPVPAHPERGHPSAGLLHRTATAGASWPLVEQYAGVLQGLVIAATVALVAVFAAGKVRQARGKVSA